MYISPLKFLAPRRAEPLLTPLDDSLLQKQYLHFISRADAIIECRALLMRALIYINYACVQIARMNAIYCSFQRKHYVR